MTCAYLPGRCKAYWLRFSARKNDNGADVGDLLESLEKFNITANKNQFTVTTEHEDALGIDLEAEMQDLPYRVRYSFDVCLSHGYLYTLLNPFLIVRRNEYTISKRFIDRLKALSPATACGILDIIAVGRKTVSDPMNYLDAAQATYKGAYRIDSIQGLPSYCKRIQRCVITPACVLLKSPSIDVTNRVIRHFIRYLDRFLRVTCDLPCGI